MAVTKARSTQCSITELMALRQLRHDRPADRSGPCGACPSYVFIEKHNGGEWGEWNGVSLSATAPKRLPVRYASRKSHATRCESEAPW